MKKLLSAFFMATGLFAGAQNVTVRGFVLDKDNSQPLSLCAIQVKNSQLGATTVLLNCPYR